MAGKLIIVCSAKKESDLDMIANAGLKILTSLHIYCCVSSESQRAKNTLRAALPNLSYPKVYKLNMMEEALTDREVWEALCFAFGEQAEGRERNKLFKELDELKKLETICAILVATEDTAVRSAVSRISNEGGNIGPGDFVTLEACPDNGWKNMEVIKSLPCEKVGS